MFEPRLGLILLFEGDKRRVHAAIDNVTAFTNVSAVLKQGDSDLTSTYVSSAATFSGNILWSGIIGGVTTIPAGNYRYFITGTYTNKLRTWYWDVLVIPKELTYLSEISLEDYDPFIEEVVTYEGDTAVRQVTLPGMDFSVAPGATTGVFKLLNEDVTATYCSSAASANGGTLTTHNIGAQASIPPGDYGYFISGTFNNSEAIATWYYKWKVVAKSSII